MGSVDKLEDKSAIASPSVLSLQSSRLAFKQSYVGTLLPALNSIQNQGASISFNERLIAIKHAANMSLALSVTGNPSWRQALMQELLMQDEARPSLANGCMINAPDRKPSNLLKVRRNVARISNAKRVSQSSLDNPANYSTQLFLNKLRRLRRRRRRSVVNGKLTLNNHSSYYVKVLRKLRPSVNPCNNRNKGASAHTHKKVSRASCSSAISIGKIKSLGGLVPGGLHMDVPLLLQEAADYILSLQLQVEALQSLAQFGPSNSL